MDYYKIEVGIEHLMTGIIFYGMNDQPVKALQFSRVSASIVMAISDEPFRAYWPNRSHMDCTKVEWKHEMAHDGEVEWYAQAIAGTMRLKEQSLYDARHDRTDKSREMESEPKDFPSAVVKAMIRKHGAEARKYLLQLRWYGSYWGYSHAGMFCGVEPDGYIHT